MGGFGLSCKEQLSAGSETLRDFCERSMEMPVSVDDWTSHFIQPSWSLCFVGSRNWPSWETGTPSTLKYLINHLTIRKDDPQEKVFYQGIS